MHTYLLYSMDTCPYCQKVLRYMAQNNIEIPIKDYTAPGVREEVICIGGKAQVPCLLIDGVALYESDDIVRYMKEEML